MPSANEKEARKKTRALAKVLVNAAKAGDLGGVRSSLAEGLHPDDVPASHLRTALIQAAAAGHWLVVEYLCQAGADIRASTGEGKTALHTAARLRRARAVECLLANGADPRQRDAGGIAPLLDAVEHRAGDPECVSLLLQAGADPNDTPGGKPSQELYYPTLLALPCAMLHGHAECVALLLDAGANPSPLLAKKHETSLEKAKRFREGKNIHEREINPKRRRAIVKIFEERGLLG